MTNNEAASLLVRMNALLVKGGYNDEKYHEAVSLACGYLLIDSVLDRRPQIEDEERGIRHCDEYEGR